MIRALSPSFIIVGVQKCGTTALADILNQHPDCALSKYKEVEFFSKFERAEGMTLVQQLGYATHWRLKDYVPGRQRFEASPAYAFTGRPGRLQLELIRAYRPDMRLICSFRDPVKRAYSQWNMERQLKLISEGFEDALHCEAIGTPSERNYYSFLAHGAYDRIVENLWAVFPREQVHLMLQEDLKEHHEREVLRVQEFLGLRPLPLPALVSHERPYTFEPMREETRSRLAAHFAPSNARFAAMTGLDVSRWTQPAGG